MQTGSDGRGKVTLMAVPVPITARIHYDDVRKEYRLVARKEIPTSGGAFGVNEFVELVLKFATLLEALAALADFMAGVAPVGGAAPSSPTIGDWVAFMKWASSRAGTG